MRRASSRPEITSIGWASTMRACARNASRLPAPRADWVATPRGPVGGGDEARQAAPRRFIGEEALGVQARAQAHGFLEVVDAPVAALLHLADLQAEAVGTEVDRGGRAAR